jgi:superfamily II DNA or RNA helicase/predicted nucleic acid-binding Zn finger protein
VVMGTVARDWPVGRVLVIAHREELVNQAAEKLSAICGEDCGVEMRSSRSQGARVVVASVQTLNSHRNGFYRMMELDPMSFGLVMTDEAHHATAPSYRRIYEWFRKNPDLCELGVTATPDRADEEALGQIFDSVAYEYDILTAMNDGWLVPVEQQFVHVEGLDLSKCDSHKSDLKDSDVARVMQEEAMVHKIVAPTIELAGDKKTLLFAASVAHATKAAEIFNRHRTGSAFAIDGTTDTEERKRLLKAYKRGDFQFLCNCAVFLEGFDEPSIELIANARPTKSRALYAQVAGRGTRPLPGVVDGLLTPEERIAAIRASAKPSMMMLDFVGNSGRHKLVCTADILGGNESDEVVEWATASAQRKSKGGESVDMQEELEAAREELERQLQEKHKRDEARQATEDRRKAIRATAKFSTKAINPFDIFDIVPKREPGWHKGRKPTPGQVSALGKFGVDGDTIAKLSFCQASQMMDTLVKRRQQNLCSVKQAKILGKYGYNTDASFTEAKQIIDALAANRWQPITRPLVGASA